MNDTVGGIEIPVQRGPILTTLYDGVAVDKWLDEISAPHTKQHPTVYRNWLADQPAIRLHLEPVYSIPMIWNDKLSREHECYFVLDLTEPERGQLIQAGMDAIENLPPDAVGFSLNFKSLPQPDQAKVVEVVAMRAAIYRYTELGDKQHWAPMSQVRLVHWLESHHGEHRVWELKITHVEPAVHFVVYDGQVHRSI